MREKIKKCLCGARPQVMLKKFKRDILFFLQCPKCGKNKNDFFKSKHHAIMTWNRISGIQPDSKFIDY